MLESVGLTSVFTRNAPENQVQCSVRVYLSFLRFQIIICSLIFPTLIFLSFFLLCRLHLVNSSDVMSTTPTSHGAARLDHVDHGSGRMPKVPDCSDMMSNLRKAPSSHLGNSFTPSGGDGGAHHIALPSPPCLTTAPASGVHTSTLLPPSKSTTSNKNLTTTEILYNSRPKPLSPHPQLTYVTSKPIELQGCDNIDISTLNDASGGRDATAITTTTTTTTIETNSNTAVLRSLDPISLTSFASQHKELPCLDLSMNSSSSSSHHERTPSVDEDLLLVATSLAGMKRRRSGTRSTKYINDESQM